MTAFLLITAAILFVRDYRPDALKRELSVRNDTSGFIILSKDVEAVKLRVPKPDAVIITDTLWMFTCWLMDIKSERGGNKSKANSLYTIEVMLKNGATFHKKVPRALLVLLKITR